MIEIESELERAFAGPLPGVDAQLRMAPNPRHGWQPGRWPDDCRHGGGLLLLYPRDGRPHVLLTLRDAALAHHAGQVSLPGGAAEAGESYADAALREAREEVGLDPGIVRVVGALSPLHVPVSRFVIHPWVAVAHVRPHFVPDPREVARILEVPLDDLRDPARRGVAPRPEKGPLAAIPCFRLDGELVWGATAMILAEFLCLVDSPPHRPADQARP